MKLRKLGCLGCGGAGLFFVGFVTANFLLVELPGELRAAPEIGKIREIERDHEVTAGWTVREEVDRNGVRQGEHTVWEDDRLMVEGHYEHDLEVGLWRYWHPSGQLSQEISFVRGQAEGPYRHWHDNGVLAVVGSFQSDSPYGPWVYRDRRGRSDPEQTGFYVEGHRLRDLTDDELGALEAAEGR